MVSALNARPTEPAPTGGPDTGLRFRLLGRLGAENDHGPLALGSLKQRAVLAALLGHPNTLISTDLLTEAVWEGEPPRSARKNLQVYISGLRGALAAARPGADRVVHRPGGYELHVADHELDTLRFQHLARAGREAAAQEAHARAARLLAEALHLWEGPPLPELRHSPVLRAMAERLTARYLAVVEDWAEAELRAGDATTVANTLADLVEQHPLRERLRAVHLLALHRAGRRAEALEAFSQLRQQLSRELGLAPGPELEACHRTILSDHPPRPARTTRHPGLTLLPPDAADFTGREEELDDVLHALRRAHRPVAVTGPVGVGKSALAVRAAHLLRADFPDGRLHLPLRTPDGTPRTPQAVATDLARFMDPCATPSTDPERTLAQWRDWLTDHRVLLVLDAVHDERQARALLPPPGPSAALATSRAPLSGLGATHQVDLAPHTEPQALALLTALIGPRRTDSAPAAARRIVTACGLLPSAVRLAGQKLAALRHLPLEEFADRLDDPRHVLDELAVGTCAIRHRLTGQWNALDDEQRHTLTRLARLPRPHAATLDFTLDDAAHALGLDARDALGALEKLIVAGVVLSPPEEVSAHTARYALPRLTHVHAGEHPPAADR
jgi:DNA-binding SARP family transcriptional activator